MDIVVCVHDALDDVRACIGALWRTVRRPGRLILVDDGSGPGTRAYLESVAARTANVILVRHELARGYTAAANAGVGRGSAPFVVLLNSDTVVLGDWLERCLRAARGRRVAAVGPMSNAASWQSLPEPRLEAGRWIPNDLPPGWSVAEMAKLVAAVAVPHHPRVPLLNGFCLVLRRAAFERVGGLDEVAFPVGYGEENDLCIRLGRAGFELVVCDDAYVWHGKSRSFTAERAARLAHEGGRTLEQRYGKQLVSRLARRTRDTAALRDLRRAVASAMETWRPSSPVGPAAAEMRVLFLLPVKGGAGGAHSVVQEARAIHAMSAFAQVAVPEAFRANYLAAYPDYSSATFHFYETESALRDYAATFHVVVATIFTSVEILARIVEEHPRVRPAYYVQDYEPMFAPEGTPAHERALASYTLVPGMRAFAKTNWIRDMVTSRHGVRVDKVVASIDHDIYRPPAAVRAAAVVRVCAMIRPSTPRRNAAGTMRVLAATQRRRPIAVDLFGVRSSDRGFRRLERGFAYTLHGRLQQRGVAELLQAADVFVDLSSYQAFGRTALEAMACGCAVVLTRHGGVDEYARDGENCLLVDPRDEDGCVEALSRLAADVALRQRLQAAAVETARRFTTEAAAASELQVFRDLLAGDENEIREPSPPSTQR